MISSVPVRESTGAVGRSPASLRFVDEVEDLAAIFEPEVSALVLRRASSFELTEESDRLVRVVGFHKLLVLDQSSEARDIVGTELAGYPALAGDVARWVEILTDITDASRIGVRLARVAAPMCPRFHVDLVTVRLVLTYHGTATEMVDANDVDRTRLGHASRGMTDETSGLLRSGAEIQAARSGEVVLLKGERWPGNAGRGAIHRSPFADADSPRLVMTLDPV